MITVEDIKDVLIYEPDTGNFYWKEKSLNHFPDERAMKSWNTKYSGKQAGNRTGTNYIHINIKNKLYYAHKLAFHLMHGYMPSIVDHINRDKRDNRILNLRPATASQNQINKTVQRNSSTGAKGVNAFHTGNKRWRARIQVDKKKIHLGYFTTKEEASEAYRRAAIIYHGEYAGES